MKVYHHRNKQRVNEVVNQKRIIKIQKLLKAKAHHHRNKPKANVAVNLVKQTKRLQASKPNKNSKTVGIQRSFRAYINRLFLFF